MMNYKNVLFDLGGVLIDIDVQRSLDAFARLMGVNSLVTAEGLMGGHTSELIDQYQIGAISSDEFVDTLLGQCQPGITRPQIEDAWNAMVVTMPEEKKQLLHELIQRGKNVYVLSNTNDIHIRFTLAKWPELKQVKRLFFSHEIGLSKPDPRCYELVIKETGIKPEETVYVDDLLPNIEAGQQFGFQCLHAVDDGWLDRFAVRSKMNIKNKNTMEFKYEPMFQLGKDETEYYLLTKDHVSVGEFEGKEILKVDAEGLTMMAQQAFHDVSFMLRRSHNLQVAKILNDPEASDNDKYVALTFLRNAEVAAKGQLPLCQDTGTAIIHGEKGQCVFTGFCDEEALSRGVYNTYTECNLRYSQNAPLTMYEEVNTKCNLPAQIDLEASEGAEYRFLCVTKGGGSANKSYLYQETKARIQNPGTLIPFLVEKMKSLGTAACPPYHIAIVIGGTSAEKNLLTVKLASTHYYDSLPTTGSEGGRAFRDVELEKQLLQEAYKIGLGAQFGGKYMAHDVRVIRLPRHGASCPIGLGVSCSADRNIKCKINKEGIWIEKMDQNPGELIPAALRQAGEGNAVKVNLNQPMKEVCKQLSNYPIGTRLSLNGTIIVGRDIAHAKIKARLDAGEAMPEYLKNHPIYYAGPAKTPAGMACGSMGPTTAGRMDPYVDEFQDKGGSLIMLAKGNRSIDVTNACQKHGGFYLGSIGGPAAILAQENIKSIECVEYPELGMEAIWKIEVENFPAFILVDDKGNDFFKQLKPCTGCTII